MGKIELKLEWNTNLKTTWVISVFDPSLYSKTMVKKGSGLQDYSLETLSVVAV